MTLFINSLSLCIVISDFFFFFNLTCTEIYYISIFKLHTIQNAKELFGQNVYVFYSIAKFEMGLVMKGR